MRSADLKLVIHQCTDDIIFPEYKRLLDQVEAAKAQLGGKRARQEAEEDEDEETTRFLKAIELDDAEGEGENVGEDQEQAGEQFSILFSAL